MFRAVLVANRGEIARRIFSTLSALGIESIAVYTDADRAASHVAAADRALRIGSYLSVEDVVAAAVAAGADAVHPGYGFLSERAALAAAVETAGVTWIGPPPASIDAMGDKIRAKATVAAAGVPVVPGVSGAGLSVAELAAAAVEVGLPVLLKPSAGGGGKGMRRVADPAALPEEIAAAQREAAGAFGDDTLLVERWITRPRHIEIQVFADSHGGVIHLGERECSLQRRHQKIIEEAPSALLTPDQRAAMGASAVAAARSCGYVGAGTVEFIVSSDAPGDYFFMEMNTRLQVEHPVTEMVTGLDLVEWQLRIAAGAPLPLTQDQVTMDGHAVEARVYAEDPARGFLPAAGPIALLREPRGRPGVRVDSGIAAGGTVGTGFDPMLSKIIAWGPDRPAALARLRAALASSAVLGVTTNVGFLGRLLADPDVATGRLDTELVDRVAADLAAPPKPDEDAAAVAAALALALELEPGGGAVVDPWDVPGGWRLGAPAETVWRVRLSGRPVTLGVTGRAASASVRVARGETALGDEPAVEASTHPSAAGEMVVRVGGTSTTWTVARTGDGLWLGHGGDSWRVAPDPALLAGAAAVAGDGGPVTSPMPGTVLAVHVGAGEEVAAGQRLVTVEAMKMEHVVVAPVAGTVTSLPAAVGRSVALDETLAVVTPADHPADFSNPSEEVPS
ncbi:biotin carboxylase N-terminal domain-containing protein [Acidiferrimicrobium sp. IK]|uniref:ATP-binding protein n=1 Tax=Acidiferrimicrobium sp. IK TaxID=2871700 RepID=UPI003966B892